MWIDCLDDIEEMVSYAKLDRLYGGLYSSFDESAEANADSVAFHLEWGRALYLHFYVDPVEERLNLLHTAYDKCRTALDISPEDEHALFNCALVLSDIALFESGQKMDSAFEDVYDILKKGCDLHPEHCEMRVLWGDVLCSEAECREETEKAEFIENAREKYLAAERISRGQAAYELACLSALQGNEAECRKWLKVGEEAMTLPSREEAMNDERLKSVRDKDWFKNITWQFDQIGEAIKDMFIGVLKGKQTIK